MVAWLRAVFCRLLFIEILSPSSSNYDGWCFIKDDNPRLLLVSSCWSLHSSPLLSPAPLSAVELVGHYSSPVKVFFSEIDFEVFLQAGGKKAPLTASNRLFKHLFLDLVVNSQLHTITCAFLSPNNFHIMLNILQEALGVFYWRQRTKVEALIWKSYWT